MSSVELYNVRRKRQRPVVTFDSDSDSDDQDSDAEQEFSTSRGKKDPNAKAIDSTEKALSENSGVTQFASIIEQNEEFDTKDQIDIAAELEDDELLKKTQDILQKSMRNRATAQSEHSANVDAVECVVLDDSSSEGEEDLLLGNTDEALNQTIELDDFVLRLRINGDTVESFDLCESKPIESLALKFCAKHHLLREAIVLRVDGRIPDSDDTIEDLELEEGDLIDATVDFTMQESVSLNGRTKPSNSRKRVSAKVQCGQLLTLQLSFQGQMNNYKIGEFVNLNGLFKEFSRRHSLEVENIKMVFDDHEITPTENAAYYGIENLSVLRVEEIKPDDEDDCDIVASSFQASADNSANTAISLYLQLTDSTQERGKYTIKIMSPVSKLIEAFCDQNGYDESLIQLKIDGEIMLPEKGLEFYDLEEDEVIDVLVKQNDSSAGGISIILQDSAKSREKYTIALTAKVEKLVDAYCKQHSLERKNVSLRLDGEVIGNNTTLEDHDLEDEDILDVIIRK